jgi:hypothetical protein
MPRDLADLALSAARTASALPEAQRRGVQKAALHVTTVIRSEIRSVTGDMRLSGVGRRGAKVGASFKVSGTGGSATVKATGPLHIIERDMPPHDIQPRGYRVSKRYLNLVAKGKLPADGKRIYLGGGKALKFGGGFYRRASLAGGSRGKHPFERGWKKAAPETTRIFQREVRATFRKSWGI